MIITCEVGAAVILDACGEVKVRVVIASLRSLQSKQVRVAHRLFHKRMKAVAQCWYIS